jgi:hypothetical protein
MLKTGSNILRGGADSTCVPHPTPAQTRRCFSPPHRRSPRVLGAVYFFLGDVCAHPEPAEGRVRGLLGGALCCLANSKSPPKKRKLCIHYLYTAGWRLVAPLSSISCRIPRQHGQNCLLLFTNSPNIAQSALAGQGAVARATARFSGPYRLLLPSRVRALVSAMGCPQTSIFSLLCTRRLFTCPWLPEPHSA